VPDVIIVAIGTNDFSPGISQPEFYINSYLVFLLKLRTDYPMALMVVTEGTMLGGGGRFTLVDYLQQIVNRQHDHTFYFTAPQAYGDAQDAHPTVAEHRQIAQ
jgi:hypothetical protein